MKDSNFSIADALKHPERYTNDGGYLIPGEVMNEPIYTPRWPNWFGRLLLRWFKIRDKSKDTTLLEQFKNVKILR